MHTPVRPQLPPHGAPLSPLCGIALVLGFGVAAIVAFFPFENTRAQAVYAAIGSKAERPAARGGVRVVSGRPSVSGAAVAIATAVAVAVAAPALRAAPAPAGNSSVPRASEVFSPRDASPLESETAPSF